jgi:hypothetical protein
MSISFSQYPKMTQTIGFNTAVSDISYLIKNTQVSGSSRGDFGATDYAGEGVYFENGSTTVINFLDAIESGSSDAYAQGNSDKVYTSNDKIIKENKMMNNVKISDICTKQESGSTISCAGSGADKKLSITFIRPSAQANISDLSQSSGVYNFYDKGYIEFYQNGLSGNDKKCIIIYKFGQIDLKNGKCSEQ